MLGNDIIDIQDVLASGQALRPGFKERICLDTEMSPLVDRFSEEYCTWILWAIKESAYKYYIQAGGAPILAPKKFQFSANLMTPELITGQTKTPVGIIASEVRLRKDYLIAESFSIHSSASTIHRKTCRLDAPKQKEQSRQLKQLIGEHLAEELAVSAEEVSIKKNHRQVPSIYLRKDRLPYSISLSHHGAWGLFSYQTEQYH